jgi:small-conductance mechanosensitive channel
MTTDKTAELKKALEISDMRTAFKTELTKESYQIVRQLARVRAEALDNLLETYSVEDIQSKLSMKRYNDGSEEIFLEGESILKLPSLQMMIDVTALEQAEF